jgi:myo-inositol 2-dehydrogenase/D-chiro-inositol 1-dehydrogenase
MKKNESLAEKNIGRRKFISETALAAIGTIGSAGIISSCKEKAAKKLKEKLPLLRTKAPDGKVLKAGLIGCGARGAGAAVNFVDAGPNLQITALGDIFRDKLDLCRISGRNEILKYLMKIASLGLTAIRR